ncbi:MAG: hypothetical protein HKN01_09355 [Acidimicrobiia bacterium]|nr:hypothetical protein [Acidimicrobiia bacterium]
MERRVIFVAAWIAVTGLSVFVATQAVGVVRDQVTTAPAPLTTIAAVAADTTTTTSTTIPTATSTTVSPTTSPTTSEAMTTTTAASTAGSTTTTMAPAPVQIATYQLAGGWVRIQYDSAEVRLVDAAPYAGFSMSIEKTGPPTVVVEFESGEYEAKFRAVIESGELEVVIENDDDD